ncbi:hypothetical protein HNR31_001453 [Anoxybacillus caldiproteolyticus]|uniref:Uncharacterized protein n=1 Tax=Thermaerobacillus caldiproteolyticus TaxID=247480 RepID=A0A7V9Z5Y9_9BACL|nr:hypothetical protein [Anoxybacillus caldiproteolyticus]
MKKQKKKRKEKLRRRELLDLDGSESSDAQKSAWGD